MPNNTKTDDELMESLGGEWNSAYGHWEFRFSENRTKIFINPDEASILRERISLLANSEVLQVLDRIKSELKKTNQIYATGKSWVKYNDVDSIIAAERANYE